MQIQKARVLAGSARRLLHRNARGHLANMLTKLRSPDVANLLRELSDRDQKALFAILMQEELALAAETLNNLEPEHATLLLQPLSSQEISQILQEMDSDDAAAFISALPEELAEEVLDLMRGKQSKEVQGLLRYEEETAGRIMTPNVFALDEDVTVSEAINAVQAGTDLEMVFYIYVVDDRHHLVGVVSLRQLLVVPPSTPLKKMMSTDLLSVTTETDQEEVARQVALYDLLAIPVVDHQNRLVGMITVDDVIDVIQEEATEDILHLAGVNTDDHVYTSRWQSYKKRIPWLAVNLATLMVAAKVVDIYEATIAAWPFLAIFLPVVAGLGGNAGTQALALTVRGLALGEISWSSSRSAVFKELVLGLGNGITIGLLAGVAGFFWIGNWKLGLILGAALIINLFVAGIIGSAIPLILTRLRIDPAVASSMLLTTITDAVGFFAFLAMAFRFL